jgi:CO/xanthine dehydrogenase Mo-binding subunit
MTETMRYVGMRRPRADGRDKVLGATRYAADQVIPGSLHARIVPSVYAHARIRSIDATTALALPGVVAVLTAADLPIVALGPERHLEPLAREEVLFAGQPIALVVAESETAAADAATLVEIDLEPLEPVVDVLAAARPGAALVRALGAADTGPAVGAEHRGSDGGAGDGAGGNVFESLHERRGDVESAFAESAVIVEGRFRAGWVHQAAIEPQAATAWLEPDGTLVVQASMQGIFLTRDELARAYGLPTSRVRVIAALSGGAFGAKQLVLEPLVAGAALRLRRPVRIVLDRRDDFAAMSPSQGLDLDVRIGADARGRLLAIEARVTYDAGAFAEDSWQWFAPRLITGPYRWPSFDVTAFGVHTNRFGTGNFRAPTGPPGFFALETLLDELALRLQIDPVDLRAANVVAVGDPMANGSPWPRTGALECLARVRSHPIWLGRDALPPGEGVGMALGVWPGSAQPAAASCRLEPDGTLTVVTGVVDISGAAGGLAIIAAEAFGVPVEQVNVVAADTGSAPHTPSSNASAITYAVGPAVQTAATQARGRLLHVAGDELEINPANLEIVDAMVRPRGSPAAGRSVADLARELHDSFDSPYPPVEGHGTTAHTERAPSLAAHLAHVRVDEDTGEVQVLGYAVVQDVGRALNPALVDGQMTGAAVQAIGRALHEELVHDEHGQLVTGTFLDYALPRATMVPPIDTQIVEVPAPEGPFGARGIGEACVVAGPAAVANAIAAVTGVRMRRLPMTAPRVWAALRSTRGSSPA